MRVLFPVWELEPFIKVGGLGVVARSLPTALKQNGIDIRVVIPHYKAVKMFHQRAQVLGIVYVPYGDKMIPVTVSMMHFLHEDIPVYLLANKHYFDKPIPETFALFAGAVTALVQSPLLQGWVPEVVHCNDNHCGLIPLLFKIKYIPIKTILTIHCLSHQRKSPAVFATKLGIPPASLSLSQWDTKQKQLNFLTEGITHADLVTTVSPTYLKEIQTEELGAGLDDLMRTHLSKTHAILNGIDYALHDPATHPALAKKFSVHQNLIKARQTNKARLQKQFGLPVKRDVTVIGFVGRFDVNQKGIDIIHRMISREQFTKCQFVIMGHGKESWEERFGTLATFLPRSVSVTTTYDDNLATLLYAGADFVLIPSHFEPCCLIQMYAMRYGAIPIARATGGLKDTINDEVNGFLYASPTARELKTAITKAITVKKTRPEDFQAMIENAMQTEFSWNKSAQAYIALYRSLITRA